MLLNGYALVTGAGTVPIYFFCLFLLTTVALDHPLLPPIAVFIPSLPILTAKRHLGFTVPITPISLISYLSLHFLVVSFPFSLVESADIERRQWPRSRNRTGICESRRFGRGVCGCES